MSPWRKYLSLREERVQSRTYFSKSVTLALTLGVTLYQLTLNNDRNTRPNQKP
jgi:hypothetical protein